ncbi:hypothetical protein LEN26_013636 [Aphanomyces euteiches]|nr:hypothetical protein LEN26_013636 [Aphanomyces euteiches]KAH9124633.1 hypothetical protein AeMF1_004651 [Aphanomyces euteiches]KAH9184328.1 hypothetical protein AeNC1_013696 [Aphanomyces euteiches]
MSAILILCALLVLVFADATSVKTTNGFPSTSLPWHSSAIITATPSQTIDMIAPAFLQSQLLVTTTTPTTGTTTPTIVRSTPTVTATTPTTATTAVPTIARSTPTVTTTTPTTAATAPTIVRSTRTVTTTIQTTTTTVPTPTIVRSTPTVTTTTPTTATTAPTIARSTLTVTTAIPTTATVDIGSTPAVTTTTPCPVSVDTNGYRVKEGREVGWEFRLLMFVLGAATFVIMALLWWYVKQRRANVQCKNTDKHQVVNTPTVSNYGVHMTPVTYENDSDTRDSNSSSEWL